MISDFEQKVWKVLQHKDRELKEHATVSIHQLYQCWQRMSGTKFVGDNFVTLVTDLIH